MKQYTLPALSLFLFCSISYSDTEYTTEELQAKLKTFTTMQVAGFTLLGIGVAGVVTGIVLASSADWETHSTGTGVTTTTRDPQGGAGIIVLAAGIPFTVAGIVLGAIGTSKRNEYKRRLEFSGFDIKTTPRYQSFGLCFTINK